MLRERYTKRCLGRGGLGATECSLGLLRVRNWEGAFLGIHVAHRTVERAEEADSELKCPKHLLRDTKEPDRQGSRGLFCSWRLLPQLGTWLWRPWYCPDQEAALISGPQSPLTIAGPAATSTAA